MLVCKFDIQETLDVFVAFKYRVVHQSTVGLTRALNEGVGILQPGTRFVDGGVDAELTAVIVDALKAEVFAVLTGGGGGVFRLVVLTVVLITTGKGNK